MHTTSHDGRWKLALGVIALVLAVLVGHYRARETTAPSRAATHTRVLAREAAPASPEASPDHGVSPGSAALPNRRALPPGVTQNQPGVSELAPGTTQFPTGVHAHPPGVGEYPPGI